MVPAAEKADANNRDVTYNETAGVKFRRFLCFPIVDPLVAIEKPLWSDTSQESIARQGHGSARMENLAKSL